MPKQSKRKISRIDSRIPESRSSHNGNLKLSFQYFDNNQPCVNVLRDWQEHGLLAQLFETFVGYCQRPLVEQLNGRIFTAYSGFPPKSKTIYDQPKFVPEDAVWARIRLSGKVRVIGHIVNDTFYVVFLDREHKFWISNK